MGKIVAIGGGEIGRPRESGKGLYPIETLPIDREIVRLTGKKNPKLLFIPTASQDSESYYPVIKKYFSKKLRCRTSVIYLIKQKYSKKALERKVFSSDIIYVGGGNTLKMLKVWRQTRFDKILKKAYEKGIVLSGVSAGAVCWFRYAHSDSRKEKNPEADYIKVNCLDFINSLCCPHYGAEKNRKKSLKQMMRKTEGVAIALENCSAFELIDNGYKILTSKKRANAYRVYWKNGKYYNERIKKIKEPQSLAELLRK